MHPLIALIPTRTYINIHTPHLLTNPSRPPDAHRPTYPSSHWPIDRTANRGTNPNSHPSSRPHRSTPDARSPSPATWRIGTPRVRLRQHNEAGGSTGECRQRPAPRARAHGVPSRATTATSVVPGGQGRPQTANEPQRSVSAEARHHKNSRPARMCIACTSKLRRVALHVVRSRTALRCFVTPMDAQSHSGLIVRRFGRARTSEVDGRLLVAIAPPHSGVTRRPPIVRGSAVAFAGGAAQAGDTCSGPTAAAQPGGRSPQLQGAGDPMPWRSGCQRRVCIAELAMRRHLTA